MRFSSTSLNLFILSYYTSNTSAFIPVTKISPAFLNHDIPKSTTTTSSLFAKKKKAKLASFDALDLLEEDDSMLSAKELAAKQKKEAKAQKKKAKEQEEAASASSEKKNLKSAALKALEQMEADETAVAAKSVEDEDQPQLSKKELKAAAKAAAKKEEKLAKKKAKKAARASMGDEDDSDDVVNGAAAVDEAIQAVTEQQSSQDAPPPQQKKKLTLEEKIRKDRPPPRIRVLESSQPNYVSLRLEDVFITFRDQEVLKGVTWGVSTNERLGLVGPNGTGKTTQIRILAGEMEPTAGDVVKSKSDLRISILRQEFIEDLDLTNTLQEEFQSVFEEEYKLLNELREQEKKLENVSGELSPDDMQNILDKMEDLQNKIQDKDVYQIDARISKIMDVMGFTSEDDASQLVSSYSGGWKMRIGLGKVLLTDPNVLLLDEPTNHLDLESVEWIEEFLINQKGLPMIIVSHDREFLDRVCNKIVDTEGGIANEYESNYSKFLQLKKSRMESWQAAYNAQEKKIKEEKAWIQKFKVKQPQAVKQRKAQLEKLKSSDSYVSKPPFLGKPLKFRFPDAPRISPEVAEIEELCHSYENNVLFKNVNLSIDKGDRIAIVGPNGSGKSTLLRLLMGTEQPSTSGSIGVTGQNVVTNYFEQNQADALDLDLTVLETIQKSSTGGQSYNELRAILGQFLFKGDNVEKQVKNLSGGEKARLSLCCMMLTPANFLLLDEPTNHLDIPAKEMLEEALQYYQGSVIIVSHDRYFISKVATTIVAIEDKDLVKYSGDYKFYMEKSAAIREKIEARYVSGVERIRSAPVIDVEKLNAELSTKKNFGGAKNAGMVTKKDKGIKNAKRNTS